MTLTLGVDVSSHQDPSGSGDRNLIDWASVERTPYDFALARMTIGRDTVDEDGRQNLRAMLKLEVPVCGAYGVVGTSEPVEDGAKLLVREIEAITNPRGVLVMLDAEDFAKRPDGTSPHPTIEQVDRYAIALRYLLGRWPYAYVPRWWLQKYGYSVKGRALANCPWVQSHYIPAPWTPAALLAAKPTDLHGFKSLGFLQYTDSATVAGITGKVDCNAYYGTVDQLRAQLLGQTEGLFMTLTDAQEQEILRAARQINATAAQGQTSFEGTVEATLRTVQSLVNLVKGAQGALAGSISDLRAALLGAITAQPGMTDEQAQVAADKILAAAKAEGVELVRDAVVEALRTHPLTPAA
jgi:GH25 family lysozyme M1 (1,4-beta-N-acetylmuramidase)